MFSADGMETATFDYASAGTWSRNERTHSWGWEETSQARSLTSEDDSRSGGANAVELLQMSYNPKVLTSISLNGDLVTFSYTSPQTRTTFLDSAGEGGYNFPRLLSGISIASGDGTDNRNWTVTSDCGSGNRPVLTALTESRGGDLYDRWAFTYVNKGGTSRYSQDWFGYNNGETGRDHLSV